MKYYKIIAPSTKEKAIEYYIAGMPSTKLAKIFHVDKATILNWLKAANIPRRTAKAAIQRYAINTKFFDVIDDEHKAYWLGFLLSDGNISKSGRNGKARTLRCALQWRDKSHLQKLLDAMGSEHKIIPKFSNGHKAAWLAITTIDLCSALESHGWSAFKKSGDISILNTVSKHLQQHLVRGMIDGDGHLGVHQNRYRFQFVDLHKSVVSWIYNWLVNHCMLNKTKIRRPSRAYSCQFGGKQVIGIAMLYNDSKVSLDRKQIIAEMMLRQQG